MDAVSTDLERGACADLAVRILNGDSAAETLLVQRTRPALVRLLARRLRDRSLAEDLCHDAYAIVLQRLRAGGLSDPGGLAGFIAATARNLAIDHHRKASRRRTDADDEKILEAAADDRSDPAHSVGRQDLAAVVRRLLEELPVARDRDLLAAYYLRDESKEQLCTEFGVTELHFNRILHRARQRFAELLRERAGVGDLREVFLLLLFAAALQVSASARDVDPPSMTAGKGALLAPGAAP